MPARVVSGHGTVGRVSVQWLPAEALEFYEQLEADNSRAFWQENKATYETAVKTPMQELCDELAEYGPFHLFRPYNDLRFAKDRPPYKTAQGAVTAGRGRHRLLPADLGDGLMAAAGYYMMAKDQLERFREAVDGEHTGAEIAGSSTAVERPGYAVGAHRRAEVGTPWLLEGPSAYRPAAPQGTDGVAFVAAAKWMHTKQAADKVRDRVGRRAPMCALARRPCRPEHAAADPTFAR